MVMTTLTHCVCFGIAKSDNICLITFTFSGVSLCNQIDSFMSTMTNSVGHVP
jgi:hypothetical protein